MTNTKHYQLIFDNWRRHSSDLDITESSIYSYTGSVKDPDDPLKTWDPATVKKTAVTDDDEIGHGNLIRGYDAAIVEDNRAILSAVAIAGGVVVTVGALLVVYKAAQRLGPLFYRAIKKDGIKKGVARLIGRSAIRAALLAAGFKLALLAAAGYGLYKIWESLQPEGIAIDHSKGPGTPGHIKKVVAGEATIGIRAWREASKTTEGKALQCAFCKENKNRQYPEVKVRTAREYTLGSPEKLRFDAIEANVKKNGPFCRDILKDCPDVATIPAAPTSVAAAPGQYGFTHSLEGAAKANSEAFLNELISFGITNKYALAGALATFGKESGYKIASEGARYTVDQLKGDKKSVSKRLRKLFSREKLGAPTHAHYVALSKETVAISKEIGGGDVALLNLIYGYNRSQLDEQIRLPILIDGNINPELYKRKRAGWKYRGRTHIQLTFKSTYKRAAALAGIPLGEIEANPDVILRADMAAKMSAAYIKLGYKKIVYKSGGEPQTMEDGIKMMVWLVGAPGKKSFPAYLIPTLKRAMKTGNRYIDFGDGRAVT